MDTEWLIATVLVILFALLLTHFLLRRGKVHGAQMIAVAVLAYFVVLACLWATKDVVRVSDNRTEKRLMLALGGGLLAQLLIVLDRAIRGTLPSKRVSPLYLRGVLGSLAGLVALLIAAIPFRSVPAIDDLPAVVCGLVGGALGVGVLEYTRRRPFGGDNS